METLCLLGTAAASCLALWIAARRWLRLAPSALSPALRATVETVGATALFWALNGALCAAAALAARRLGIGFVSLYLSGDLTLLVVALLQALLFEAWRRHSKASS
jgi:hypothetical protein